MPDDENRRLIQSRATAAEIKDAAVRRHPHVRDDGTEKILAGVTTIPEVERVTADPDILEAARGEPERLALRIEAGRRLVAVFTYKATDSRSADLRGTVAADTPRQARDVLRGRGLIVKDLATPDQGGAGQSMLTRRA